MDLYVLIQWPTSQKYMEEDWFDEEAILGESSSYFIPAHRVLNDKQYTRMQSILDEIH